MNNHIRKINYVKKYNDTATMYCYSEKFGDTVNVL